MKANIEVQMSFGTFDYPSEGSEFFYGSSDEPKEFLIKHLPHYLDEIHYGIFKGATLHLYNEDDTGYIRQSIALYRFKIDDYKYRLTKEMDLLLDEKVEF